VVDEDRRRVEELRKHGLTAIYGDATAAGVLEAAGVERARLLILAIPQGFQKRRIIELARQANPHIETAVRTHRASEVAYLKDQGVGIAIMGRREVAFGLLRYALSRFGLPDERVQTIVQTARASGEGGAFEREPDIEPPDAAPELRERGDDDSSR
jgi:CPA2 family monovalent cation:H+ antiporter-2